MSGPFRPYPGNGGGPGSQGNQPVSFKTDINRKKTKKWVAAKSYSYDGDDWGDDDDDDEEEEEEQAPPPLPTDTSRFYANITPQQPPSIAASQNQPASTFVASHPPVDVSDIKNSQPPSVQTPAFVRPADIYKRMQEERERERRSQESGRSGSVPPAVPVPASAPSPHTRPHDTHEEIPSRADDVGQSTASPLVIPELKRLSGFGQDLLNTTSNSEQPTQHAQIAQPQPGAQDSPLQHNPSLGFRSVVNQAFDVPETPTSSNETFSRSDSDSTSVISPIISRGNLEKDKTPTIAEEPAGEASPEEPPADFKPGHRRDLSVPSPGNGPDRVPTISTAEHGQSANIMSPSESEESLGTSEDTIPHITDERPASGEATPRPLSALHDSVEGSELQTASAQSQLESKNEESQSLGPTPLDIPQEQSRAIPQVMPSVSTETSPHDMESDRLRKEIMRSLSPDPTAVVNPSAIPDTTEFRQSQYRPGHESTYLPSEYESYWNDQQDITPTSPLQPKPSAAPTEPLNLSINTKAATQTSSEEPTTDSVVSASHPKLKKKFSWEGSDNSDEEDVLVESSDPALDVPPVQSTSTAEEQRATEIAEITQPAMISGDAVRDTAVEGVDHAPDDHGLPEYSFIEKETVLNPDHTAPEVGEPRGQDALALLENQASAPQVSIPSESPVPSQPVQNLSSRPADTEKPILSFRQIMEIQSPSEKVRIFNATREQFALNDSGLEDWIRRSSDSFPEHADLIRLNGQLPGGAPTGALPPRAKFPKLSSLGNLSLPSSHSHSDVSQPASSPGHARRPSGSPITGIIHRQNVESKGKDLLHSAGVLGGKAGGAARGLFAKGKSKLRGSADKVD